MPGISSSLVLSEDGSTLAYFTGIGANPIGSIYLRDMHTNVTRELSDIDRAYNVFFSPDGSWLGYVTPTQLFKVPVSGGAPLELADVNRSRGASWGANGQIVYTPDQTSGLFRIAAVGGKPEPLTELGEGETSHRFPDHLPGGRYVIYAAYSGLDRVDGVLRVLDTETGVSEELHRGGNFPRYSTSGHLLYWSGGTIYAAPFDVSTRKMTAMPVPVVQDVAGNREGGAHFDVAGDGTLIYMKGGANDVSEARNTLEWMDREGRVTPMSDVVGGYNAGFALSPDQRFAAVTRWVDGNGDVWVIDLDRSTQTRLTFDNGPEIGPRWSPDGRTVYFSARRGGSFQIYAKAADGSSDAVPVHPSDHDQFLSDLSSDGRWMAYQTTHPDTRDDIWVCDLENGTAEPFLQTPFQDLFARFSPDLRWVAYVTNESGDPYVYVRPFPGPGGRWQISSAPGTFPRWAPDGKSLFYIGDQQLMEVAVDTEGDALRAGRPESVGALDVRFQTLNDWNVSADGSRFGFIRGASASTSIGSPSSSRFWRSCNSAFSRRRRRRATRARGRDRRGRWRCPGRGRRPRSTRAAPPRAGPAVRARRPGRAARRRRPPGCAACRGSAVPPRRGDSGG
jgi:serine/threonine-protein kinase